MKIITNLETPDLENTTFDFLKQNDNTIETIKLEFPQSCLPLVFFKTKLQELQNNFPQAIVFLCGTFAGRRIINQDNSNLCNHRRIRTYFAISYNNKIIIEYGWNKIKKLNENELNFIQNNWHQLLLMQKGSFLTLKSGGTILYQKLFYQINKKLFNTSK